MTRPVDDLYAAYQNCLDLFYDERRRIASIGAAYLILVSELDQDVLNNPAVKKFRETLENILKC